MEITKEFQVESKIQSEYGYSLQLVLMEQLEGQLAGQEETVTCPCIFGTASLEVDLEEWLAVEPGDKFDMILRKRTD